MTMDNLVAQLRSGIDNADGGEMGGVVLTMRLAADEIERLKLELSRIRAEGHAPNGFVLRAWPKMQSGQYTGSNTI